LTVIVGIHQASKYEDSDGSLDRGIALYIHRRNQHPEILLTSSDISKSDCCGCHLSASIDDQVGHETNHPASPKLTS
jgi:hypothetical protein